MSCLTAKHPSTSRSGKTLVAVVSVLHVAADVAMATSHRTVHAASLALYISRTCTVRSGTGCNDA
jgi:hypothetical protein